MNSTEKGIRNFFSSEKIFDVFIIIRGIYSIIQLIFGILILFLTKNIITKTLIHLVSGELSRDPKDQIANLLFKFASNLSLSTKEFIASYFIIHGLVNIILIYGLLKEKKWSYPIALGFFIIFLIFEIYRFLIRGNMLVFILILLDMIIIFFIANKYFKILKKK